MTSAPDAAAAARLPVQLGKARGWRIIATDGRQTVFAIGCGLSLAIEVCPGGPVLATLEARVGDIADFQNAEDLASALGARLAEVVPAVARPDMAL